MTKSPRSGNLLDLVRAARRERQKIADESQPHRRLVSLVEVLVRARCEASGDAKATATALALLLSVGPDEECVDGAGKLLSEAGFGEVAPEDLAKVLRHPAYKKFANQFMRRLPNGQKDHHAVHDLASFHKMRDLAVEAAAGTS
jgi:hypothetical protein